jgi:hypothetical protein
MGGWAATLRHIFLTTSSSVSLSIIVSYIGDD